jgi:hypothetical protein
MFSGVCTICFGHFHFIETIDPVTHHRFTQEMIVFREGTWPLYPLPTHHRNILSLKGWYPPTSPHSITTQNNNTVMESVRCYEALVNTYKTA